MPVYPTIEACVRALPPVTDGEAAAADCVFVDDGGTVVIDAGDGTEPFVVAVLPSYDLAAPYAAALRRALASVIDDALAEEREACADAAEFVRQHPFIDYDRRTAKAIARRIRDRK